jgi:hypothetical protein
MTGRDERLVRDGWAAAAVFLKMELPDKGVRGKFGGVSVWN